MYENETSEGFALRFIAIARDISKYGIVHKALRPNCKKNRKKLAF